MFKKKSRGMPESPSEFSLSQALGAQKYGKKKKALGFKDGGYVEPQYDQYGRKIERKSRIPGGDGSPSIDPVKAKEMQDGAEEPFSFKKSLARGKKALGFKDGGAVAESGHPYSRNLGTPAKKPDDHRLPEHEYMGENGSYGEPPPRKPDDSRPPMERYMADHFAEGGLVESIAEAVMRKMAEGGQVDLEHHSEEEPNQYYDMNEDTANEEQYDLSQLSKQPEDSNQKGDDEDDEESDKHGMVSAIRSKMKAKKGR